MTDGGARRATRRVSRVARSSSIALRARVRRSTWTPRVGLTMIPPAATLSRTYCSKLSPTAPAADASRSDSSYKPIRPAGVSAWSRARKRKKRSPRPRRRTPAVRACSRIDSLVPVAHRLVDERAPVKRLGEAGFMRPPGVSRGDPEGECTGGVIHVRRDPWARAPLADAEDELSERASWSAQENALCPAGAMDPESDLPDGGRRAGRRLPR